MGADRLGGGGGGGGGGGFPRPPQEAHVQISEIQRRRSLEKELRRDIGRASLPQLEILAATTRNFGLSRVEEPADDSVESGSHFEGDFGGGSV